MQEMIVARRRASERKGNNTLLSEWCPLLDKREIQIAVGFHGLSTET